MCKVVYDFIKSADRGNGFGYFADNETAVLFAKAISRSQKRKYNRYGIIPAAFFNYLEEIEAIKREEFIPEKFRTVFNLFCIEKIKNILPGIYYILIDNTISRF